MEWLMRLAFQESCDCCDVSTWDFEWWVAWREHVKVYFNLPRCSHCVVAIDFSNEGSDGRCGPCWM